MPTFLLFLFRFARLLFSGHAALALENAALRLQLAAFQRKRKRPVLTDFDRLIWVALSLLWTGWRVPLLSKPILSSAGSASGFAGSGHGCRGRTGAVTADPRSQSR